MLTHQKWWNLCCDSTSCWKVKCRLCAICSNQWFFWFSFVFGWEITKIFLIITHRWDCWSPHVIPTYAGPCSRQDPLPLPCNNRAPLPLCGCWDVLFLWKPYVTRNNWHWTRTHKTVRILSVLDRFWQRRGQEDMMTYKDSLSKIPFSSLETQTMSHEMQTNWLTLSQKVIRTKCCTHDWKRSMALAYIRTRQQKAWSPVTNRRYFRRHGCPWKCLRKWNTHSSLPWEWWLPRSRWAPSRALTRFWAVPFLLGNITSFALSLFLSRFPRRPSFPAPRCLQPLCHPSKFSRPQSVSKEQSKWYFVSKLMDSWLVFRRNRVILNQWTKRNDWSFTRFSKTSFVWSLPIRQEILNVSQISIAFHGLCPPFFIQTYLLSLCVLLSQQSHLFLICVMLTYNDSKKDLHKPCQIPKNCQCKWL